MTLACSLQDNVVGLRAHTCSCYAATVLGELKSVSDHLRRFLAISAALQRSKSQQWWADELRQQGQAGQGEGCCMVRMQNLLRQAVRQDMSDQARPMPGDLQSFAWSSAVSWLHA